MYPFGKGRSRLYPYLFLLLPLSLYVAFLFGPSVFTVIFSFTDVTSVPGQGFSFVGLDNYKEIFFSSNTPERYAAIQRTIYFAIVVTVIQNSVGLLMALVLNQKLKGDKFFRSVFFIPVLLGVTVVGLIWQLMFNPINGPVQKIYGLFGYSDTFFGNFEHAFEYIMFVQIWMYMGYSMLIFLAGLQTVPKDLYEAAYIDGANSWQSFKNITFPMIAPAFTVNILLSIIGALQTYDIIIVLTRGNFNTSTIGFDVYSETFRSNTIDLGLPAALSMIQFLIVLIFVVVSQHYLRKREVG
ncbi:MULTISPECIES: sugar ABC transporter permease [Bacillaceae]|uniref:carbohydrate ABC transporter permease n=1 Tax=Bacillaceae TaxID=186817 RepID=UPI001BDDE931|nr:MULTISPECIES: sugar ABC transporter permease [Bacillaceae]MDX8361313.1 sugar ABC transporter permease [Cytobacillus sp. IB215316]